MKQINNLQNKTSLHVIKSECQENQNFTSVELCELHNEKKLQNFFKKAKKTFPEEAATAGD